MKPEIDISGSDNVTSTVDSSEDPAIVGLMNTALADLSVALPGEMMDFEAILAGDPDFQAHMNIRDAESLAFQMAQDEEFPY